MLPRPWGGLSPFEVLWQLFQSLFNWDFDSLGPHSSPLTRLSYLLNQLTGWRLWFKKYVNSCIWPSSSFKNALSSLINTCLYFYIIFSNVSHFNPHIKEKLTFNFPSHLTFPPSLYESTSDAPFIRGWHGPHTEAYSLQSPSELCCMTDDPMSPSSVPLSSWSIPSTFFF